MIGKTNLSIGNTNLTRSQVVTTLKMGTDINTIIKDLQNTGVDISFSRSESMPGEGTTYYNIESSGNPVLLWKSGSSILWYCNSESVLMNENSSYMFGDCINIISIDMTGMDTSKVTTMSYMFYNCNKLNSLDLSSFNTSNVTNMSGIFYMCSSLTSLNVS